MTSMHLRSNFWLRSICLLFTILACGSGNAQVLSEADSAYAKGDYESAFAILSKLAEKGDPAAQSKLSILYRDGLGVGADRDTAFRWSQEAARQGEPGAQYDIGDAFLEGKYIPKSVDNAVVWYKKSAEQGFPTAAYRLASIYYDGEHLQQDIGRSYYWMLIAADLRYPESDKYSLDIEKLVEVNEIPAIRESATVTSKAIIKSIGSRIGESCIIIQSNNSISPRTVETLHMLSLMRLNATLWGSDDHHSNSFSIRIGPFSDSHQAQQALSKLELRGFRGLDLHCDSVKNHVEQAPLVIRTEPTQYKNVQNLPAYPVQRGKDACPNGYSASNMYCVPGSNARYAIARSNGNCPQGYTVSGGYCLANHNTTRLAIHRVRDCPNGYNMSGGFCLSIDLLRGF